MTRTTTERTRLLITGAAGRIGTSYREHLAAAGSPYALRLADRRPIEAADGAEVQTLDLADPESTRRACQGADVVLHLAADPRTRAEFYADLLDANFKVTYNVFRAAADCGCRRVIFASSVNAVGAYHPGRQIRPEDAPRPANVYGVCKAFGESLGAYFATVEKLSTICVRIGGVGHADNLKPGPPAHWYSFFVSHRDLNHLFDRCIEADGIDFAIVHGTSNNRYLRMELETTSQLLGYHPQDDAFARMSGG